MSAVCLLLAKHVDIPCRRRSLGPLPSSFDNHCFCSPGVPDVAAAGAVVPAAGQAGRRGGPLRRTQDLDLRGGVPPPPPGMMVDQIHRSSFVVNLLVLKFLEIWYNLNSNLAAMQRGVQPEVAACRAGEDTEPGRIAQFSNACKHV